jgi:primosomal protein DnaI
MKKIGEVLPQYKSKKSPDDRIEALLEDPIIRAFAIKNDLKHNVLLNGINNLISFQEQKAICNQCKGLHECKLAYTGMTPKLNYYEQEISLDYEKCRHNTKEDRKGKIDALYIPRKVFDADLSDLDLIGQTRKDIHQYMLRFLSKYTRSTPMKGMYLSGMFGTGKTYILACMANELEKLGFKITFAYYPDLVRELKSSIGKGDLEERIAALKTAEVLMLDDIGGESPSGFIRDEVLGPILQHRVLDELPTFFSSNIQLTELISAFMIDKTENEKTKSVRINERIRELSVEFKLSEKPIR